MEPSLWMPAAGDRERRLPCFARGLIPDGCELLERCWVLEAYSQRTACSSFCLFIALGSAVRPAASLLCVSCCSRSILVSFNCFCSPRAVLTPNTCCLLSLSKQVRSQVIAFSRVPWISRSLDQLRAVCITKYFSGFVS